MAINDPFARNYACSHGGPRLALGGRGKRRQWKRQWQSASGSASTREQFAGKRLRCRPWCFIARRFLTKRRNAESGGMLNPAFLHLGACGSILAASRGTPARGVTDRLSARDLDRQNAITRVLR